VKKSVWAYVIGIFGVFAFALIFQAQPVFAATISPTVTTATGGPADCTFADALSAANTNLAVNGCPAGDAYPTVDIVSLGAAIYHTQQAITNDEAVTISGAGKSSSRVVLDNDLSPSWVFDVNFDKPSNQTHTFTFQNFTLEAPDYLYSAFGFANSSHSSIRFMHMGLEGVSGPEYFGQVQVNASNTTAVNVVYDDAASGPLSFSQDDDSTLTTTIANSSFKSSSNSGTAVIAMYSYSTNSGDTTITNSDLDGGGDTPYGVLHDNTNANARFTIDSSTITDVIVGVNNIECTLDTALSAGSLYLLNSSIGGTGMKIGMLLACGHGYVKDSTFSDITGSAVVVHTNTLDSFAARSSSRFESYNTTYANITPDNDYYSDVAYVMPAVYLNSVIVFNTDISGSAATGSRAYLTHNTFAGNTLGSNANISFTNPASFAVFSLKNNAIEGVAMSGSYAATTKTISNNLTTGSSSSGIAHVDDLLLGPLQDNGGSSAIGMNGAAGNVLTMMPLLASPLVDNAPYAGLSTDERGVARSMMASYDVGAVEISVAEYTALGGVWPLPTAPDSGVGALPRTNISWEPLAITTLLLVVLRYIWRMKRH
jgi:hypothetical protein